LLNAQAVFCYSAPMGRTFYVYILTNHARTLYIGMANDLERRVYEHKHKLFPGFTAKYNTIN
jgi:putative endonuclease